jgi:phage gpG-like protein
VRLALEVVGVPEAAAGIEGGVARMQIAAFKQMGLEMLALRNYVVTEHLNGPTGATTLQQRSGNLARSTTNEVQEDDAGVTGLVGIPTASTAQSYARILHDGGTTRAHVIEVQKGKALAFMMGGQLTFHRRIQHPGSNFPARPYLVSALEEQAEQIKSNHAAAMLEAVQ